MMESKNQGALW